MSDPTVGVKVEVTLVTRIEQALASIRQLSRAAVADSGMPTDERARAIAAEIALTRQLRDEEEREKRGGGSIRGRPTDKPTAEFRDKANSEITTLYKDLTEDLDAATKSAVADMVRTKQQQQSYYRQLDSEAGRTAAPERAGNTPRSAIEDFDKQSTAAKAELASQRHARIGEGSEEFQATLAELDAENKRFSGVMSRLRLYFEDEFGTYIEAAAEATVALRLQAAAVTQTAAADREYIEATISLAESRRLVQQSTVLTGAGYTQERIAGMSPEERADEAARLTRRERLRTTARQTGTVAPEEITEQVSLKTVQAEVRAAFQALASETTALVQALADNRIAQTNAATATTEAVLNTEGGVESLTRNRLARDQETIALKAQYDEAIASGQLPGSPVQRLRALASPRAANPALEQTGAEGLVTRGLSSASYMLSGFASGAAIFGIVNAVKEATKLEEVFAGLRGQLEAIGQGDSFGAVSSGIKDIANETGIAASEVAKFTSRIVGLVGDPTRAIEETRSAIELAVVSGTDTNTLLTQLVPTMTAFGVSAQEIGDEVVGLHDKFGVAESDALQFFGQTAETAKAAGFSFQELGPIGAAAANSLGVSMGQAGQQFAKVIETMQGSQDKIFAIYRTNPNTAGLVKPIVEAFGRGDVGDAFKQILGSYNQLDRVQQENLVRVSGSRREWALLNGIFSRSAEILGDMSQATSGADGAAGGLQRRFDAVAGTVGQSLGRIKQLFTDIAEGVFATGLGGALALIGKSVETVLGLVNLLVSAFVKLNDATRIPGFDSGLLAPMVQFGVAVYAASKAIDVFNAIRNGAFGRSFRLAKDEDGLTVAIGRRTAAEAEGVSVTETDTASKGANAAATGEAALAEDGLAASRTTEAGAGALTWTGSRYRGAGGRFVSNATAEEAGLFSHLPLPPTAGNPLRNFFGGSPLATRALAGGDYLKVGAADEAAAAAASTTGVGLGFGLALPAIAALQVKSTRDKTSEDLNKQASALREQLKSASDDRVNQLAQDFDGFWDDVQQGILGVDLPGKLGKIEQATRVGQRGATGIGILQSRGELAQFADHFSDATITDINTYLNKNRENFDYAKELGVTIDQNVGQKLLALGQTLTNTGGLTALFPSLTGTASFNRDDAKKLLPTIKARADAGEAGAAQLAFYVEQEINKSRTYGEIRKAISDALAAKDVGKAVTEAGGIDQYLQLQGLYDPEGQYQTGQISQAQYVALIRQKVEDLGTQLEGAPDREKAQKAFDQELKKALDAQDSLNLANVEVVKRMAPLTSSRPKADILAAELAAMPTLSVQKQVDNLPEYETATWDAYQETLNQAHSPEEYKQRATAGTEVSPEVKILQVVRNIKNNAKIMALVERAAPGADLDKYVLSVATEHVKTGKAIKDILLDKVKADAKASGIDIAVPAWERSAQDVSDSDWAGLEPQVTTEKPPADVVDKTTTEQENVLRKAAIGLDASRHGSDSMAAARARLATAQADLDKLIHIRDTDPDQAGPTIQADIDNAAKGVNEALFGIAAIEDQVTEGLMNWAIINAYGNPVKQANARLALAHQHTVDVLKQVAGNTKDPNYIKAQQDEAQSVIQVQAANDAHNQLLLDWGTVLANGDPMAAALNARLKAVQALNDAVRNAGGDMNADPVIKAQQDLTRSDQEIEKQQQTIDDSRYAVLLAKASRDPLQSALLSQRRAHEAAARAKGTAAQNNADAAAIAADRSVEDALSAGIEARANLAIALANVAGDPVKAAKIAMEEAKRKLDEVVGQGVTDPKVLAPFQGTLATATENYFRTGRSQEEKITDFQLQMGQITTQAAIESLRLILARTKDGTDEYMSLAEKIHGLEQQAGQDLQYNLPSDIGLPTLYESRRVAQSTVAGMGYQDNRNIVLSVNVNGAQDPMAVTNQIMSAFSAAVGSGNTYAPLTSGVNW